jgi:hypothetical protein
VKELDERIAATEAARLVRTFAAVRAGHRIFDANSQELGEILVLNASTQFGLVLWNVQNRALLEAFLDEATRRLYNYVASAMSLVDHTRRAIRKVYPQDSRPRAEYEERVRKDFAHLPEIRFVQDLRDVMLHVDVLNVNARLRWDRSSGEKRELILSRERLMSWSGWSPPAHEFLVRNPDDILVEPLIRNYTATVSGFYNWLADWHRQQHIQAFIELEVLQAKVRQIVIDGGLADPDDPTTRRRSLRDIKEAIAEAERRSEPERRGGGAN